MQIKKKLILTLTIVFILFGHNKFSNCVSYKALPLDALPILSEEAQSISFNYLIFNKKDCSKYLGRDKVIKRGYQPIQISFTNNTNRSFILNLTNFNLNCISHVEVAENLHFNIVNRVVGWTIGALFIWPLVIGAIVEGVESPKANDKLEADYANKALTNQIVKPHSTVHGLIFVPVNSFHTDFSFRVNDSETNESFLLSVECPIIKFLKKKVVVD